MSKLKNKQVKESKAINFINKIIASGRVLNKVKYNGQPSQERYVWVEWIEPQEISL